MSEIDHTFAVANRQKIHQHRAVQDALSELRFTGAHMEERGIAGFWDDDSPYHVLTMEGHIIPRMEAAIENFREALKQARAAFTPEGKPVLRAVSGERDD